MAHVLMMSFNLAGGWIGKLPPKLTVESLDPWITVFHEQKKHESTVMIAFVNGNKAGSMEVRKRTIVLAI